MAQDYITIRKADYEALLAENHALKQQVASLREQVAQLQRQLTLGRKPPLTSQNSSQPPSKDIKRNICRVRKRHGPPRGHPKYERARVEHPDQIIEQRLDRCPSCGNDVRSAVQTCVACNQITEIPPTRALVIETQQYAVCCDVCQHEAIAPLPEGLEQERHFGARLESLIVYLKQEHHLSYARLKQLLADLWAISLSEGGIDHILQRAAKRLAPAAEALRQAIQQSPVVQSDETSVRVQGQTHWEWVFRNSTTVYQTIDRHRSGAVIERVFATATPDVWVSDCYSAQLSARSQQHQLCLAHLLRELEGIRQAAPRVHWSAAMQDLLRQAIHLANRRTTLSARGFQRRRTQIERACTTLLRCRVRAPDAKKMQHRLRKHRDKLFVFLYRTDVPYDNNASERALRPSVVHRKVINGFRSVWGANAYACYASVVNTAKACGENVFQTLLGLMGTPALSLG
jgi:transposase